jgi:L-alanine-DL-glutamate epimerase-like enolase superfamily enzyme
VKITNVEAIILEAPGAYAAPSGAEEAYGIKYLPLLRVSTDEGITGIADIESQPHVIKAIVEAPSHGANLFDSLREIVVGRDPFEVERLWKDMFEGTYYYGRRGAVLQAISGIDIACWDIMGKATGLPAYKLLGAGYRDRVRAYASTLFRPTPEAMAEACRGYLEQGFTAIKFGWGVFGRDPALDVRLMEAARRAVGDEVALLVDAGWAVHRTPKESIAMIERIAPYNPFWVEEPCHPEDYRGYATVAAVVRTLIAAGEQEATVWGFRQLIDEGRVDVVQPDLSRCGGLTIARQVAHMAAERNVAVCPHAWTSQILLAASLHYNAFLPDALFIEYSTAMGPLTRALCRNPLEMEDGYVRVPQGPGLGVEIDETVIERYRVA